MRLRRLGLVVGVVSCASYPLPVWHRTFTNDSVGGFTPLPVWPISLKSLKDLYLVDREEI